MTEAPPTKKPLLLRLIVHCLSGLCFLACLPLLAIAAHRLFDIQPSRWSVLADTFMPYVFLLAYVIVVFAIAARRKILAVLATFLIVCHLVWMAPELQMADPLPASATTAPSLTVFNQNVRYDNATPSLIGEAIKRHDAGVVFLQELSFDDLNAFQQAGALDNYPYRILKPARGAAGMGMLSKYPLENQSVNPMRGFPSIRANITIDGYALTLWSVHAHAPPVESGTLDDWSEDLAYVKRRLHAEPGNVIAGGDFNATWSHRPYREIASNGYEDVHQQRGRGLARTWPLHNSLGARASGIIRIDHMLTRGTVRATSIEEEPGHGSDHRGLLARFALI